MKILNKNSEAFLQRYLDNHAPTGYESSGQKIWLDYRTPEKSRMLTQARWNHEKSL